MDRRSRPPGDGLPPSTMKLVTLLLVSSSFSANKSLGRAVPGGCPHPAHWGLVQGNQADVSELVRGERCSLALPACDTCFLRAPCGPRRRPPPRAQGPRLSGGVHAAAAGHRACGPGHRASLPFCWGGRPSCRQSCWRRFSSCFEPEVTGAGFLHPQGQCGRDAPRTSPVGGIMASGAQGCTSGTPSLFSSQDR